MATSKFHDRLSDIDACDHTSLHLKATRETEVFFQCVAIFGRELRDVWCAMDEKSDAIGVQVVCDPSSPAKLVEATL